jgi:hypothetical protein
MRQKLITLLLLMIIMLLRQLRRTMITLRPPPMHLLLHRLLLKRYQHILVTPRMLYRLLTRHLLLALQQRNAIYL